MPGKVSAGRLIAEGLVIVASILAAFGIQAWWDNRLEHQEETRVLAALLDEAIENRSEFERMTTYHCEALENLSGLFKVGGQAGTDISADSIDQLLIHASGWLLPAYNRSALDLTLLGGKLPLLDNTALARQITKWERSLEQILDFERGHGLFMQNVWIPFLRSNASVPQLSNAQTSILGGGEAYASPSPVVFLLDHAPLFGLREFQNILQEKKWSHEDALAVYEAVEYALEELSIGLRMELGAS